MILIFTGKGKGKTTSAIGQGIRVVGQGGKVLMIQFIKSKKWPTGEEKVLSRFKDKFQVIKGGKGFVGIMGDKLPRTVHQKSALETLKKVKEAIVSEKYDLIILDEVNVALSLRLIKIKDVVNILKTAPKNLDLILTGRGAPKELIKMADLVTEFKEVKHPFKKGTLGARGREY